MGSAPPHAPGGSIRPPTPPVVRRLAVPGALRPVESCEDHNQALGEVREEG